MDESKFATMIFTTTNPEGVPRDDRIAFFAICRLCNGYVYGVYGANALDAWFLRFFNGELSRGGRAPQISNKSN